MSEKITDKQKLQALPDQYQKSPETVYRKFVAKFGKKKQGSEPARHSLKAAQDTHFSFSAVVLILVLLFLFLPLIVIGIFSFNDGKAIVWTGFSLRWYQELFFDSAKLWLSFKNSLIIAFVSAFISTVIGSFAAIGVQWYRFKGRFYAQTISFLPMVLPEVIIGMSMLIFFSAINIPLGLASIIIAHITFCLPFIFLLVLARLDDFDFSIVEAARDLGANEWQTLYKVIIPAIMPGILSGFLMSVTLSLEDFVITFFVSGPGSTTLPLYVFSMVRYGISPVINALSLIMVLGTIAIAYLLRNFLKTIAASN
ncbi:ABC transporter permease [Treponema phagedenis]|uniref:ABC transporter permease n=1 Tax=Treponema phagedenis TaxID=162 RepID=A0A0B7GU17_TREPH|nr:ABC transporter permease [Treponema phagedenis]EFW37252.1 ABC transporter, permease protein [Treponema phagedenis F0421]NVP24956.1 ABC transporter permease [Treponema phagedenis]QEJ94424.1 ABC transporter permease [Treponema phagedenis]QEJ96667.1 ABC transporter permease [Treponema phagedenis]QEK01695.1 ABC transporter permease [Treponema phagedenis]